MKPLRTRLGGLDAIVLEPTDSAGTVTANVVLSHGFGAPGEDLVGLAGELVHVAPALSKSVRWVFPAAPLSLAELGYPGGRAWWHLDLERLVAGRDWSTYVLEVPEGLPKARRMYLALLEELQAGTKVPLSRTVLGGFSQGAMLATDVALRLEEPPLGSSRSRARSSARRRGRSAPRSAQGCRCSRATAGRTPSSPTKSASSCARSSRTRS